MQLRKITAYIGFGLLILGSTQAWCAPNASLLASRLTGPAPLSVSFDATGTTSSISTLNTFRETGYHFLFDDPSSGNWLHSNKSKNEQIGGPIAAHVFDTPGTYNVELRVREPDGSTDTDNLTITVTDPGQVFSGTNTVVISRTDDTSGAPAGAQLITNASGWPSWQSGKRYLLRAGQDFAGLGNINIQQLQDVQIDKLGAENNPTVADIVIEGNVSAANWAARVTVRHMSATRLYANLSSDHSLFYQNTSANNIDNGSSVEWYATSWSGDETLRSQMTWPTNFFVVENTVSDPDTNIINGAGSTGFGGRGSVWMGNSLAGSYSHSMRLWFAYKTFIGHNYLTATPIASPITTHIKLHSSGTDAYMDQILDSPTPATRYVVIADNRVGDGDENKSWSLNASPQNSLASTEEGLEDIIMENNLFDRQYSANVSMSGRNMIERGSANLDNTTANVATGHTAATGWDGPYYFGSPVIEPIELSSVPNPPAPPGNVAVEIIEN